MTRSRLLLGSLALALVAGTVAAATEACSDDQIYDTTETPTTAGQIVGPEGGSIVATDGTTLLVPAGALTSQVTITIAPNPTAPILETGTALAVAHIFGPEGQQFAKAVSITLAFDPTMLPAGTTASDVKMYTAALASNDYQVVPTTLTDASHVTGTTTHFSNYLPAVPNAGSLDGGATDAGLADASDATDAGDASSDSATDADAADSSDASDAAD